MTTNDADDLTNEQESEDKTASINKTLGKTLGPGPGERLRKAREKAELSVEEVAKHLCLNPSIIRAIEMNDYTNVSGLTFMRGYLRAYSRLVGVPHDEAMEAFNNLNLVEKPAHITTQALYQRHSSIPERLFSWVTGLLVLGFIVSIFFWWKNQQSHQFDPSKTAPTPVQPKTKSAYRAVPMNEPVPKILPIVVPVVQPVANNIPINTSTVSNPNSATNVPTAGNTQFTNTLPMQQNIQTTNVQPQPLISASPPEQISTQIPVQTPAQTQVQVPSQMPTTVTQAPMPMTEVPVSNINPQPVLPDTSNSQLNETTAPLAPANVKNKQKRSKKIVITPPFG